MTAFGSKSHRKAPGFVLVGVLIVVMLLSMIALSLMFRMRSEETAGATGSASEQGWATAMSGVRGVTIGMPFAAMAMAPRRNRSLMLAGVFDGTGFSGMRQAFVPT